MASGVLILDKPRDWTSMDVCAKLRGVFHEKRVGHGGTLDPMATGVLPIFVGRATRAADFVAAEEKEYIAGLRLGVTTNTQDVTGEVTSQAPPDAPLPTREDLCALLPHFLGEQEQLPPMYSAVKIGGKKLYELARKGVEVERQPRRITIFELELLETEGADALLRVRCSKGTYVRTLCHDIGTALGCGGCMASLRRTRVGRSTLAEAVTLDEILATESPETYIHPVDSCFSYPKVTISGLALKRALCGNPFPLHTPAGTYRVYDETGTFLLLGRSDGRECRIIKSFFEVGS